MKPSERLARHMGGVKKIAARHGAESGLRNLRVFGSVARGEDDEKSDIDFLVDTVRGKTDLLMVCKMEREMEELLGCHVDVVTAGSVPQDLMAEIAGEARAI